MDGDEPSWWFFILGTCDGDMGLEKCPNRIEFESSSVKNLNENNIIKNIHILFIHI